MSARTRLHRDGAAPPVRLVHIGLGAFHRSHQLWYTARATDAEDWGVAAFTVRSPAAAAPLAAQGGLYTLIERGPEHDEATILSPLAIAADGADLELFDALIARPETAAVTLTITERGYGAADDVDRAVALHADDLARIAGGAPPRSPLGRLFGGLVVRWRREGAPLAVVPCDNVPDNGAHVAGLMGAFAGRLQPAMRDWLASEVSFVSTSVDRITPRTSAADITAAARLTGYDDLAPVVAEPFSDWVLAGGFPAGRPDWASAGATYADDAAPYTRRKLWLLNGAHTILAALGIPLGHRTVAEAMADPVVAAEVEQFWAAANAHLPAELDGPQYVLRLRDRFANARIEHLLEQIQQDAAAKHALRIQPVADAERAAGREFPLGDRVLESIRAIEHDTAPHS